MKQEREERLYDRAAAILEGARAGLGEPILWHLAIRRHTDAMLDLAGRISRRGKSADPFSRDGLEYRAYRLGAERAAQHIAMSRFNSNDLKGYRLWLRRAAQTGDVEALSELRRFETRLPHGAAKDIGRYRPDRISDGWWTANRRASRPTKYYPPSPFRPRGEQ